ncbi:MAG: efflux RND transporter periplasmic adaptor subunit [bacterium]|nr:efflux RND transporter periplasmic adaptor subunit [bacterium]
MNRLAIVLLFIVFLIMTTSCGKKSRTKPVFKKRPVSVTVEKVKRGVLSRSLNYKGTVLPWQRANIGPEISGRVKKIYKKPGDWAKKNELLAELDTATVKLLLKQAEAVLETANAAYKDARLNFQRLETLYRKDAISRLRMEKAQLALESATTQKKSAEANRDVVKHNLENSYMRAPFKGIITSKNLEEGDIINPMMGMSSGVLTFMDLSKVKIVLAVPAEDIEKISPGQPCKIEVNTLPGRVFAGEVYSKNLAADVVSKTFTVELKVENPGIEIKAGIFADVSIEISRNENLLILPLSALIVREGADCVVLYNDGTAKLAHIKTGRRNDRVFEIRDGLEEGEPVVVKGNYDLKEGSPITVEKGDKR